MKRGWRTRPCCLKLNVGYHGLNQASYVETLVDHNFTQGSENTSASCYPLGMGTPWKSPLAPYVDAC